ncbi:DUF4244 domain-containing protein [Schaalia sp. 19OD2882]|nr:DUF4244 domain-containing protein [Schaalia sp. 19OD2882]
MRRWAQEHAEALAARRRRRASPAPGGDPEEGSTTVEYAIGAVAAAGFAGLLLVILKSGAVKSALQGIIERALSL